MLIELKYTG